MSSNPSGGALGTVVVTGASSGVGAEAARMFHRLGARVIAVGRDPAATRALADELGIDGLTVDFADLADVHRLTGELRSLVPRIDVLAANAGGIPRARAVTADGIEPIFQVNAIAPWLLTTLLAPRLAGGRVVATSSRSHTGASLTRGETAAVATGTSGLGTHKVYARAKLSAGILLREFGRRHPEITVADFHPGIIASGFGRYLGPAGSVLTTLSRPFLGTPADGARRLVALATRTDRIDGTYFVHDRPAPGSPQLHDPAFGAELRALAERLTAHHGPGATTSP
ncbi:SDR family NAD(P)-dependent oxidoreductase [Streptomyces sp. uw30]|uniref:SDR family NAD(P)-dependent oxidoreductase n=1 Tax=Streptomyces sp. uw30 TaxID=1828179 RepID=UPI0011CE26A9|nr:SDR family NAD(P)-dependent oxidoreductase [Streptomyces sp. uw30]TXS39752.1 SDR family NAD(P)-dependent oxidoreductase [Streptomyces sp. uw30]